MRDPEFQDNVDAYRHPASRGIPIRPRTIWQRMSRVVEAIIYVLIVLIVIKLFSPELDRHHELQSELEKLEAVNLEKERNVARLRREHSHLTSDRAYMEAVARDRLNLQRKGEYIIQIERPVADPTGHSR